MTNIYCTYLTIYKGNKLPPFYIGYSTVSKVTNGYRGSVSSKCYKHLWYQELIDHPELFITHIISTHNTIEQAKAKEGQLQRAVHAHTNPLYANRQIQGEKFYFTEQEYKEMVKKRLADPQYHAKLTNNNKRTWSDPQIRARRIERIRAAKHTDKYRQEQSIRSQLQAQDPKYIKSLSTGVKKSWERTGERERRSQIQKNMYKNNPELIESKKKRKWWNNGLTEVFSETCPDGWKRGRAIKPYQRKEERTAK
jgi:hypothetical protein